MPTEAGAKGHGHSPGTPGTPSSRSSRKDPPPAPPDAWICTSGLQKPAEGRSPRPGEARGELSALCVGLGVRQKCCPPQVDSEAE